MSIRIGDKKITSGLGVKGEIGKLSELTDALVNNEQDGQIIQYQDEHWVNVDKFTPAEKAAVESGINATKVNTYDNHVADADKHIITQTQQAAVNSGINQSMVSSISSHINMGDSLHLNTQEKKDAATSGITAEKVSDYDTHIADEDIHVTAEDKARWDAGKTYKEGTGIDITDKEETITPAVPSEVELETTVEDVTELELDDMDKFEAHVQEDGDYTLTFNQGYWYFGEEQTTPAAFGIIFHNESGSLKSGETITAHYTKGTPEVKGINTYISTDKTVFRNLVLENTGATDNTINIQVDNSDTTASIIGNGASSNSVIIGGKIVSGSAPASSVIIGRDAQGKSGSEVAVGNSAITSNVGDIAIGKSAQIAASTLPSSFPTDSNIAIGNGATVTPPMSTNSTGISIGKNASSTNSISIGRASTSSRFGIALGQDADATSAGNLGSNIAIGASAKANASMPWDANGAIAIGDNAQALGRIDSIAIGRGAKNNGYGIQIGTGTKDDSNILLQIENYPLLDIAGKIENDRFDKLIKRIDEIPDFICAPVNKNQNGGLSEDLYDKYILSSLYQWAGETNTDFTHNYIYELNKKPGTYKRLFTTHKLKLKSFDPDVFFQKVDDVLDFNTWGTQVDIVEICYNFPGTSYWGPEGWNVAFYTSGATNNPDATSNKNFARKNVQVTDQSEWGFEAEVTDTYTGDNAYIKFVYRRQGTGAFVYTSAASTDAEFYVDARKLVAKSKELDVSLDGWRISAVFPDTQQGDLHYPTYIVSHPDLSENINDFVGTGGIPANWWKIPSNEFGLTMTGQPSSPIYLSSYQIVYKEPLGLFLERTDVQPNEAAGAIDAAIEAHNIDEEAHADIRELISDLQLMKFPNANIIGEPLIVGANVSRFSNTNYLTMPGLVDVRNKKFEINFCYVTGNDVNTQQNIIDSKFGLAIAIKNGHWVIAASSTGKNWDIGSGENTGTYNVEANTSYECKLTWDKSRYIFAISKDHGETWTNDIVIGSTAGLFPQTIYIGGAPNGLFGPGSVSHPCTEGTINFAHCYLKIADLVVWEGMADAGLATRATVSLDNLDAEGIKRITYTGGTNVSIVDNVISVEQTPTSWGAITGTLESQTDLKNALDAKQDVLTEGDGIDIETKSTTTGTGTNAVTTVTNTIKVDDTVFRNIAADTNSIVDVHSGTTQAPTKSDSHVELTAIGKSAYVSARESKDGTLYGYNAKNNASYGSTKRENFTAVGANSTVNNSGTTAIGANASAIMTNSTAIGYNADAGDATYNSSTANIAIGANSKVSAKDSGSSAIAIGTGAEAAASNSIQIGKGTNNISDSVQFNNFPVMDEEGYIFSDRFGPVMVKRTYELPNPMFQPLDVVWMNQSDGTDGYETNAFYRCVEDPALYFLAYGEFDSDEDKEAFEYEITNENKLFTWIETSGGPYPHRFGNIYDKPTMMAKYDAAWKLDLRSNGDVYLNAATEQFRMNAWMNVNTGATTKVGNISNINAIEQSIGVKILKAEPDGGKSIYRTIYVTSKYGNDPLYQSAHSNNGNYYSINYNKLKAAFEPLLGRDEGMEFVWNQPEEGSEEAGYWTLNRCTYKYVNTIKPKNTPVACAVDIDTREVIRDNIPTSELPDYGFENKGTATIAGHENDIKFFRYKLKTSYGRRWEKIDFGGGITEVNWGGITGTLADQTDLKTALQTSGNFRGVFANWDVVPETTEGYTADAFGDTKPQYGNVMYVIDATSYYDTAWGTISFDTDENDHSIMNYTIDIDGEETVTDSIAGNAEFSFGPNDDLKLVRTIQGTQDRVKILVSADSVFLSDMFFNDGANHAEFYRMKYKGETLYQVVHGTEYRLKEISLNFGCGYSEGTWLFMYQGDWDTDGKAGWKKILNLTPAESSASWGSITGTLSHQTDLQNALNNKQDNLTFSTGLSNVDNVVTSQAVVFRTWKEE